MHERDRTCRAEILSVIDDLARRLRDVTRDIESLRRRVECSGSTELWSSAAEPLSAVGANATGERKKSSVQPEHSKMKSSVQPEHSTAKDWPHAPVHRLEGAGVYMVTCGTLGKEHLFRGEERLAMLEDWLLRLAKQYDWQLEARAVFSNHYHFVARSPPQAATLKAFLSHLHTQTAADINRRDGSQGRQVWHNFWDSRITYERSYLARLNYVHQNAVRHGLVPVANQYPWCSAAWFERVSPPALITTIYGFKTDRVNVRDDF